MQDTGKFIASMFALQYCSFSCNYTSIKAIFPAMHLFPEGLDPPVLFISRPYPQFLAHFQPWSTHSGIRGIIIWGELEIYTDEFVLFVREKLTIL